MRKWTDIKKRIDRNAGPKQITITNPSYAESRQGWTPNRAISEIDTGRWCDAYEAEDKNAILIALLKRAYERLHFLEEESTDLEDEICNAIESK